ncbi:MAG TPA: hypothetical protein VGF67_14010 [Ktedonobacteraceae bacterium]
MRQNWVRCILPTRPQARLKRVGSGARVEHCLKCVIAVAADVALFFATPERRYSSLPDLFPGAIARGDVAGWSGPCYGDVAFPSSAAGLRQRV